METLGRLFITTRFSSLLLLVNFSYKVNIKPRKNT